MRGREDLVDEMAGAAAAGLVRAHAMLAAALVPGNAALGVFASQAHPDPEAVRREVLTAVGGRTQWQPPRASAGARVVTAGVGARPRGACRRCGTRRGC